MFAPIVKFSAAALMAIALLGPAHPAAAAEAAKPVAGKNGVVRVKSAHNMADTIALIKQDVAAKGITFFTEIDQSKLANGVGISLRPSTLLLFGNPGLGTHFITAAPSAGLDWPVHLLVSQDDKGVVWTTYTDFNYIKQRHGIADRDKEFAMAAMVIQSVTGSVAAK
jgi:uncharacterized protein (DUF302 family)